MRTIELFRFEELTDEAKEIAIEEIRNNYYSYNDFGEWAIDDCTLFEPKHDELADLLGDKYNFPLFKNTRQNIYFDVERGAYLDCTEAMEITNDEHFKKWLGIDHIDGIEYSIFTPRRREESTTIQFDEYSSDFDDVIDAAIEKFDSLIHDILQRIESSIEYRFTDEAIIEDIEANEMEFEENGSKH